MPTEVPPPVPPVLEETRTGLLLSVSVQPGARRNEVTGVLDHALKVRVTAPPVEGRANNAVLALLADQLGVRRSTLEIVTGHNGRLKKINVTGLSSGELTARLQALLQRTEPSA